MMPGGFSATLAIVIITALISYRAFNSRESINLLKHSPFMEVEHKEWYRLITSGFVHADWIHLGVNMYVLYEFGQFVELHFVEWYGVWGRLIYLVVYLLAIVAGDIPSLIREKENIGYAAIGASGAVSAIVFIFIIMYPWLRLEIMFILPMPAIVAGVGYIAYSWWAANRQAPGMLGRPVGHDAHLVGSLFGILAIAILQPWVIVAFFEQILRPFG